MKNYLEFEKDLKNLEEELIELKDPFKNEGITEVDTKRISEIQEEIDKKLVLVYSNLNSWQKTQVARHEDRPKAKFFIDNLFTNFSNLSGDRQFGEDKSVVAGFALFEGQSVLVIGQEKGDDLDSRIKRNFGMMRPEGYRKCIRLMRLADKFQLPVVTFIDTPGAYPGVGAEQRGQAEAIARSIECCMSLEVPTISIIIGEGGSGGAIALASSNKIIMLENSIYSVISPEGCASILWRDSSKSLEAATAMKLSANDLLEQGIIDEIIPEPPGGAHRNRDQVLLTTREVLRKNIFELKNLSREDIYNHRKSKFLEIGRKSKIISGYEKGYKKLALKENVFNFLNNFAVSKKIGITLLSILILFLIIYVYF